MSNRYLKNNTKTKKGISPVIATVILVAVAVVIAAALAGFSSSLFGSYSQAAQISIRTMSLDATNVGTADSSTIAIVNKGGAPETVVSVSFANFGSLVDADMRPSGGVAADPESIPANGEETILFDLGDVAPTAFADTDAGKTVTFTVQTASGQSYTLSTVLQ